MKNELKRSLNNKMYVFTIISCVLSFVLAYILLISIDKYDTVSISMLQYSAYTVYSQFGFLIFPVIVIYEFNRDYREKNIIFYQKLGINTVRYYLNKVGIIIFWFTLGTIGSLFAASIIYRNFSNFLISVYYFESVLIYIVLISSIFAFLYKNILIAFCVNLFLWILGIMLSTVKPVFRFLCYYDASLVRHENFEKLLNNGNLNNNFPWENFIYNTSIFAAVLVIVIVFRRKWMKNGI